MKKNLDIKLMLLGIGFIAFYPVGAYYFDKPYDGFVASAVVIASAFLSLVGLVLLIVGFFLHQKEEK